MHETIIHHNGHRDHVFITLLFILVSQNKSLKPEYDTTLAAEYYNDASKFQKAGKYDSAIVFFDKASQIYLYLHNNSIIPKKLNLKDNWAAEKYVESINKVGRNLELSGQYNKAIELLSSIIQFSIYNLTEKNINTASSYNNIGNIYNSKGEYDKAFEFHKKALDIRLELLGEKHPSVAVSYGNIGNAYYSKGEYDKTLEFLKKALDVFMAVLGENHPNVTACYHNIGNVYQEKGEYDKALDYLMKALKIELELLGEKHPSIADTYTTIGIVYNLKGEYDKSLEYEKQALEIKLKRLGEKHPAVANSYNNIGIIFKSKGEYDQAIEFYKDALDIYLSAFSEKHPTVANSYSNIGVVYNSKDEYDKALEFQRKALDIRLELLGEIHPSVAGSYGSIGYAYFSKGNYDKALEFYNKTLDIQLELLGKKHPEVAKTLNNIGEVFFTKNQFEKAIIFFHQALYSNFKRFNEKNNVFINPMIEGYLSYDYALTSFQRKAKSFNSLNKENYDLTNLEASYQNYQLCDTLIDQVRKTMKNKSDKIALGKSASEVYDGGIGVCLELAMQSASKQDIDKYRQNAFYFSEKNKTGVLLESMNDVKAKTFAGIPDTVLQKEHDLLIDITFYEKQLAEVPDSAKEVLFRDRLFKLKQELDQFTSNLEKNYPQYYNLKYQTRTVTVQELQQKILDKKTALIEYFVGDSMIYQFVITDKNFEIYTLKKDSAFEKEVKIIRTSILNNDFKSYTSSGYLLYQWLMQPAEKLIKGKDLIIIPDGILGYIPFESLLTEDASKQKEYHKLPYLVKDHGISYAYSATLLYETINKQVQSASNDFVAYAPVFSDESNTGYVSRTHELFKEEMKSDSTRAMMRGGSYIPPIPATKIEVNQIYDLFNQKQLKAKVYTYNQAKEENIKTDDISNYKYVHFATHGFVSEDKPELSGIVLAQDTTSKEDGILYAGEIYNLKLNADIVTLSACETGLGKVARGEGIIGMTRGFFYAGASSMVVSLWKVADQSTSDLMVDFYKNLIKTQKKTTSLRDAKLNMIKSKKYAAPYYWSPFVLIGK